MSFLVAPRLSWTGGIEIPTRTLRVSVELMVFCLVHKWRYPFPCFVVALFCALCFVYRYVPYLIPRGEMFPPRVVIKVLVKWKFCVHFSFFQLYLCSGILNFRLLAPSQPRKHGDMSPPVSTGVCGGSWLISF